MTVILLCLLGYGILMLLAGLRLGVVLKQQRETRRGGYLDLTGIEL